MRKTILFASALALVGCSDRNFNKPGLLNQPRILAMQAEPPQPSVGTTTTLRALVYLPPDSTVDVTYQWTWCPLPVDSEDNCPIAQAEFDQVYAALGLGTAPSLDLGTGETASFTNPFSSQTLLGLCRSAVSLGANGATFTTVDSNRSTFKCDLAGDPIGSDVINTNPDPLGFIITVRLVVTPTGQSPLPAVFLVHLPVDDTLPTNNNPVVGGILYITSTGEEDLLDEANSVSLPREQHVKVKLALDQSFSETLVRTRTEDKANSEYLTREKFDISWFAEAGDFGGGRGDSGLGGQTTKYVPSADPAADSIAFGDAINNTWVLPKSDDYPKGTSRIIVVVRDGRDGMAWTSGSVALE